MTTLLLQVFAGIVLGVMALGTLLIALWLIVESHGMMRRAFKDSTR